MRRFKYAVCVSLVVFLMCAICDAAPKLAFLDKILRHSDDVAKLGRKAGKLTPKVRSDIVKRFPRLLNASDDVISGVRVIQDMTAKSASAGRMIENGVNPAKVAFLAGRSTKTVDTGDKIAGIFASAKVDTQAMSKMPRPAAAALRKVEGNYREAGDVFLQMERKGGSKAVDIAEQLSKYITPGNLAATAALGLLAWHMADPAGAEEAVGDFFKDHVAPMVSAPVKGMIEGGGNVAKETLETATQEAREIAARYWPTLLIAFLLLLPFFVPNLRRLPFVYLDSLFGRLNKRIAGPANIPKTDKDKKPSEQPARKGDQSKLNVYKK